MTRILAVAVLGLVAIAVPVVAQVGGTADADTSTSRVAVVDLERTLYETTAGKRAEETLEKLTKKKQAELDRDLKELQKYDAELDKQENVLKAGVLAEKKAELEKKFVALQQTYLKLEQELSAERGKLIQEVLKSAGPIIEQLAKDRGIDLVVDASAVVWSSKTVDLTDDLNAKMK